MTTEMNLKEIERKAFRSTYQDGLWDIFLGLIVMAMAFFLKFPETGYGALNILLFLGSYLVAYSIFWAGKRFITLPRMGQVVFGPIRKRKATILAIVLGVVVMFHAAIVLVSITGWLNSVWLLKVEAFLKLGGTEHLLLAAIAGLFLAPPMLLIAYFNDFPRGYYIAILMTLAVFLMILLNMPVYPLILGLAIVLPGKILFIRFLKKYPLVKEEAGHE